MNTYIAQIEQWWNDAGIASPQEGDTIIYRESRPDGTHYYGLEVAEEDFAGDSNTRILHHAPKPRPAWHDAIAVTARTVDSSARRVFVSDVNGLWNDAHSGRAYPVGRLGNVTPLIEAALDDEGDNE